MMIQLLLFAIGVYAAFGFLFAVAFLWRGIAVIDPAAAASPRAVRVVFLPGVVALWPLLLKRWIERGGVGGRGAANAEGSARAGSVTP